MASTPIENEDLRALTWYALTPSEVFAAEVIATVAHFGQTTESEGWSYITHPRAVAARVAVEFKAVAWLHDVLEDCPWMTEGALRAVGIKDGTMAALRLLTRDTQEPYAAYIERIATSGNVAALTVKLADLAHNLRPSCPNSLRRRYKPAVLRIEEALELARKVRD